MQRQGRDHPAPARRIPAADRQQDEQAPAGAARRQPERDSAGRRLDIAGALDFAPASARAANLLGGEAEAALAAA